MTSTDGDTRFVNLMTPARFGRLDVTTTVNPAAKSNRFVDVCGADIATVMRTHNQSYFLIH